jgi:dolichol-phosphate mannosyltransferase
MQLFGFNPISFFKQFIGYHMVTTFGLAINVFILWSFTEYIGAYYILSLVVGFVVVSTINYFFFRKFVFSHTKEGHLASYSKNLLISLFIMIFIFGATIFFTEVLQVYYLYSRVLASVIAGILSYFLDAKFAFNVMSDFKE